MRIVDTYQQIPKNNIVSFVSLFHNNNVVICDYGGELFLHCNLIPNLLVQFSSVAQSCLTLATPWTAARQASLSITNSRSPLKPMSIESMMPSNHLILCRPLISSSILDTYRPGEFLFQCPVFLPFYTVYGVLKARILKWFAVPFSSGPHSVRPLHHDPSVLGGPTGHGLVSLS